MDAVDACARLVERLGIGVLSASVHYAPSQSTERGRSETSPLVWRHPATGDLALLVNTHLIRGFESDSPGTGLTVTALEEVIADQHLSCRVRWSPDTIVVWDNRATLHRLSYDFLPFVRRVERISIAGS
jgi:taurine dioxygenase